MALFVRQDQSRSELQNRISSELQSRQQTDKRIEIPEQDPVFLDNQHQTNGIGFIIGLIVFIVAGVAIYLLRP